MRLEDEQKDLLAKFVEAHRNAPRKSRGNFVASGSIGKSQARFLHTRVPTLRFEGSMADAEVLAQFGFLKLSYGSDGSQLFYVLPAGIEFYETSKRSFSAVQTLENELRRFISAPELTTFHCSAFAKWEQADSLLWAADSAQQLTTIGHLCREALQEFAASLAHHHQVDVSAIEPAKTVSRLKAVLRERAVKLGDTESAFLGALISYWGTVSDLVQRQEHGSQREREPVVWEDARRVVFQTCVLMYEVVRALP